MDSKPNPVYEDFEVHTEWVHEAAEDTLIAYLPGFTKEQIRVQITTGGSLRISGERPIGGFSRFYKEIPIPSNCDPNKTTASFRGGMLHIKHPKLIIAKPSADVPTTSDQKAAAGPQPLRQPPPPSAEMPQKQINGGPEQAVQEAPPPMGASMEKQTGDEKKTDGLAKEADNVSDDKAVTDKEAPPMAATMEKQTGEKTDGLAKVADTVSDKAAPDKEAPPVAAMEKQTGDEKIDGIAAAKEADDVTDKAASDKETDDEMKDQSNAANGKREKLANGNDDKCQQQGINMDMDWLKYKQVLDGLAMGLKNPRKMMNMVLAVLLILVLSVYLRNAIRYLINY